MSDYQVLVEWIISKGYQVETDMNNLTAMILAHYEGYILDNGSWCDTMSDMDACKDFVMASGGISEFDYYC